VSEKRNRIFISYASPDKEAVERIVQCLESNNKNIWFDQNEIVWGDNIITEINTGLAESRMGIVVLSHNFFERAMPQLELNSMILLMSALRFRILPLYHGMDQHTLIERYPLLSSIRGEKANQDCETLVKKLEAAMQKTSNLMQTPSQQKPPSPRSISDPEIKDVNQAEMDNILSELRNSTSNRREATITKLRHYAGTRKIWKHDVTWETIAYLIDSKDSMDILNGLYVLEYMIKTSNKEYENDDSNPVIERAREWFAPNLIRCIYHDYERISKDSFNILSMIIKEGILSKYALEAWKSAMEERNNDNEYQNYIQLFVWYFENTSKSTQKILCDFMYDLTSKEGKMGQRAMHVYNYFIRKI